jgi:hypothetical protein
MSKTVELVEKKRNTGKLKWVVLCLLLIYPAEITITNWIAEWGYYRTISESQKSIRKFKEMNELRMTIDINQEVNSTRLRSSSVSEERLDDKGNISYALPRQEKLSNLKDWVNKVKLPLYGGIN